MGLRTCLSDVGVNYRRPVSKTLSAKKNMYTTRNPNQHFLAATESISKPRLTACIRPNETLAPIIVYVYSVFSHRSNNKTPFPAASTAMAYRLLIRNNQPKKRNTTHKSPIVYSCAHSTVESHFTVIRSNHDVFRSKTNSPYRR